MSILNFILALFVLHAAYALTVKDFRPSLFSRSKDSGFYNVETGKTNSGRILAFVDLNGDK